MGTPKNGDLTVDKSGPDITRIYTIWPASQEDLPASTSGPWHQERRWLVLDVTDGIAASYIVEGPVGYPEAILRAAEIQIIARAKFKDFKE
jgi:hypothetical protein